MLLLLLVSTQKMNPRMVLFDSKEYLVSTNSQNSKNSNYPSNKDVVLCNHCKRTASNGIRCLGMCVADNDY